MAESNANEVECYDCVVVGAGVNGSWSALHLARRGYKTLLIEQFPIPHSRGSSGGQTRMIRLANYGIPAITPIMFDSYKQWQQLQADTNTKLIRPCPMYVMFSGSEMDAMHSSIVQCGHQPKWWDPQTFNDTYGTSFPSDQLILEDPAAGILMADKCLRTVQNKFESLGGKILDEFPVDKILTIKEEGERAENNDKCTQHQERIEKRKGNVLVVGPKGSVQSSKLIVCAGPWTKNLLDRSFGFHLPLRTTKIGVYYWRIKEEWDSRKMNFSFIENSSFNGGTHVYGLPLIEYPNMVKICFHEGPETDPDDREHSDMTHIRQKMCTYVNGRFPNLDSKKPAIEENCIYTVTPDHTMVIDYVPGHSNIVFGAGFSGTGFKTGPTVGEILADLATGKETRFEVQDFGYSRFKRNGSKL